MEEFPLSPEEQIEFELKVHECRNCCTKCWQGRVMIWAFGQQQAKIYNNETFRDPTSEGR